ncbi:16S rRNA (cytidine(1402)-2'-O)-methyltransferase [Salipaludibacillus keqinensis]|uniref:Ribosomal RNA small subunit methyltransferase I n=1 Tax=Salipaludibacillus keqinensis TaxID=2045207 RepID=A0A323TQF9_9BACI|nr:16S rRNA (cytidine(1402)-2'-O)-methyltransferase [Salipaludibacillus keqinensis]PYZ91535.1 16S rRNA (cytidine(1402)-2'-O)-methyltransferase [Salipaludibacillus keqinensis]
MIKEQRSFPKQTELQGGALYLVPTPIGNLQDITFRAVETLKVADVIAAEDTRHTKKLCHVFEIETPLISYHEHNKQEREQELVNRVKRGETVALVSDAGMPAISDPGADLVKRFTEEGLTVISLPGANAAVTALVTSGLSTDSFTFVGFLARHKKQRRDQLELWRGTPSTLIFYEAPHRLKEMLKALEDELGNRQAALCRELTKQYETILRGTVHELHAWVDEQGVKGECVLIVEGASEDERLALEDVHWWEELTLEGHVKAYIDKGQPSKEAIKQVAKERKMPKRDVYQAFHVNE